MGKPFNRREFFKSVSYYIEKGYGTYNDMLSMSMRDIIEIKVGLESKQQEKQLADSLGDLKDLV